MCHVANIGLRSLLGNSMAFVRFLLTSQEVEFKEQQASEVIGLLKVCIKFVKSIRMTV